MYGMVNQAIESMVTEKFGPADWAKIKEIAGIDDPAFLAMKQYPDSVTYALAGAGVYWIQYALRGPWGQLMKSSGASTYELLAALDDMHARIAVSFPDLQPPAFRTQRQGDGLRLEYRSHRPGLALFVIGLVEGIGALYAEKVTCTQIESKDAGAPCDAFLVHAVPAAGAA